MLAKSRIAAAALAALTLTTALATTGGQAEARPRHAIGFGIAASALIGLAAASHAYAAPRYRECGFIKRYDYFGRAHYERVCSYAAY